MALIIIIAFISMVFPSSALSITSTPDPFTQDQDYVKFWALDDLDQDDDGDVTFSIVTIYVPSGYYSQYSKDNSSWNDFNNGTSISIDGGQKQIIYLRYGNGEVEWDYSGQLTFSGADRHYYDLDAYNTLIIDWDDTANIALGIYTPTGGDDVAPVPIPPTIWIFASGLVGLVGVRRKLKN